MSPSRPPFIVSSKDLAEEVGFYPDSLEPMSAGKALGRAVGLVRHGVHLERIPPGTRTSFPHAHSDSEEWAFVIEGSPSVWLDGVLHSLEPGEFVGFPSGSGICHSFINDGPRDAVLLVGGEVPKPSDRIFYPLNPARRDQLAPEQWWDFDWKASGPHPGHPRSPKKP